MASQWERWEELYGHNEDAAQPLPRFDGRPAELVNPRPIFQQGKNSLTLRYWLAGTPFRDISLAAFRLALSPAQKASVAFLYQSQGGALRRKIAAVEPSVHLIATSRISRVDSGGAEQLEALIGEHHVSVVVVDNLSRLMPQVPWSSSTSRFDEAERETLRELRRLTSRFDWPIEVVLFHLVGQAKAETLFAEGFVDAIEEVRL